MRHTHLPQLHLKVQCRPTCPGQRMARIWHCIARVRHRIARVPRRRRGRHLRVSRRAHAAGGPARVRVFARLPVVVLAVGDAGLRRARCPAPGAPVIAVGALARRPALAGRVELGRGAVLLGHGYFVREPVRKRPPAPRLPIGYLAHLDTLLCPVGCCSGSRTVVASAVASAVATLTPPLNH